MPKELRDRSQVSGLGTALAALFHARVLQESQAKPIAVRLLCLSGARLSAKISTVPTFVRPAGLVEIGNVFPRHIL